MKTHTDSNQVISKTFGTCLMHVCIYLAFGWTFTNGNFGSIQGFAEERSKTLSNTERMFDLIKTEETQSFSSETSGPKVEILEQDTAQDLPVLDSRFRFERDWQIGTECGPLAVYFFLELNGLFPELDKVRSQFGNLEKGASLAELQRVASTFGLSNTRIIQVAPRDISSLPTPFIVHWDTRDDTRGVTGHFDVVVGVSNDSGVDVIDTTNCIKKQFKYNSIAPQLSGYVLISDGSSFFWGRIFWGVFWILLTMNVFLGLYLLQRKEGTFKNEVFSP